MEVKQWTGGGQREVKSYEKGNFAAIYPMMLQRLAMRCKYGEIKYGEMSGYDKPRPSSTYLDSTLRHLIQYALGKDDEDHLAAAIWNIMAIMYNDEEKNEFRDIKARRNCDGTYTHFAKK